MKNELSKILFGLEEVGEIKTESSWAKKIGKYYQIENILFYAKKYSWKDIVSVEEVNNELWVKELIEESGHSTVRILISNTSKVASIRGEIKLLGCSSELSDFHKLVAIDIPPEISYLDFKEYLEVGEEKEDWQYQEACISSLHKRELNQFFEEEDLE